MNTNSKKKGSKSKKKGSKRDGHPDLDYREVTECIRNVLAWAIHSDMVDVSAAKETHAVLWRLAERQAVRRRSSVPNKDVARAIAEILDEYYGTSLGTSLGGLRDVVEAGRVPVFAFQERSMRRTQQSCADANKFKAMVKNCRARLAEAKEAHPSSKPAKVGE